MREFEIGGGPRLRVVTSTARASVPVLLVHGLAGSHADWSTAGWTRELQRAGRAWIAPDLRGHGASEKEHDAAAYTTTALADDLSRILDALEAERADVVGYSLGAELSLELALLHPRRVRRLVLGGVGRTRPITAAEGRALLRHATDGSAPPFGHAFRLWSWASARPDNDPAALAACLAGVSASDQLGAIDRHAGPVFLFAGTNDPIGPEIEELAQALARAELLLLPGFDHLSAFSAPAAREQAVEFLSR